MRLVFKTSLIAAALMVFAIGTAEAGGKKKGDGMERHERGDRVGWMVRQLDLTPEQSAAVEKLRAEAREDVAPLVEKERKLRDQMRDEWRKDEPDENKLVKLHRQIVKLEGKIGELGIEHRVDVLSLLTPAQRAELRTSRDDRTNRGKRRGEGKRDGMKGSAKRGEGPRMVALDGRALRATRGARFGEGRSQADRSVKRAPADNRR